MLHRAGLRRAAQAMHQRMPVQLLPLLQLRQATASTTASLATAREAQLLHSMGMGVCALALFTKIEIRTVRSVGTVKSHVCGTDSSVAAIADEVRVAVMEDV